MQSIGVAGILAVGVLVMGCTNQSGARMGMFSATAPVIAILSNDLFIGQAEGYATGSGAITIESKVNPDIRCIGQFIYEAGLSGSGVMQCNDGTSTDFRFQGLSALSGYGFGISQRGPISFTYGLTPEEAVPYLKLPRGKKLHKKGPALELINV